MNFNTKSLTKVPLFEGLSEEEITGIMPCLGAKVKEYKKNQIIFLEGEKANKFGIVLDGSVQLIKEDYSGNRSMIGIIEKKNLFAEAYACSDDEFYPVSAVAEVNSIIMIIEISHITSSCINSCNIHRLLFRNLMKIIANKNVLLGRKIEYMSKRTTKEKLMSYLSSESERAGSKSFTIPYDRQELADYLGVERSAMSAEISKLRKEGIIEANKSDFKILVP